MRLHTHEHSQIRVRIRVLHADRAAHSQGIRGKRQVKRDAEILGEEHHCAQLLDIDCNLMRRKGEA